MPLRMSATTTSVSSTRTIKTVSDALAVSGKYEIYDVFGTFEEAATYWPLNSKVSVGDTVFIYLAAPHKQIAFACDVLDVGLEESEVIEFVRPFFKCEITMKNLKIIHEASSFFVYSTWKRLSLGI